VRVLFFGNHTVGVEALTALSQTEDVVGVIAHPVDPEDGVRYRSVYGFARERGWNVIRSTGRDSGLEEFVAEAAPDLVWITDYRYILPPSIISMPRRGAVNLHPSLLPKYRGRAPINWAIIHGETRLGLTAHFVDEGVDSGDIIEQASFDLAPEQDVGDAFEALYPLYRNLTRRVLDSFRAGAPPRMPQDHRLATTFPRRKPEDGRINWAEPKRAVWNLIRAVAFPYPGAYTMAAGEKLTIWKARDSAHSLNPGPTPGTVIDVSGEGIHVTCGDGVLQLTKVECGSGGDGVNLRTGLVLRSHE
jgi:methionyl-tRNA formyltransferase